ncbi:MAG TPA: hypothetical protein VGI39_44655 [Polyangiaceae bacterium]|jgi:hypothetical protein
MLRRFRSSFAFQPRVAWVVASVAFTGALVASEGGCSNISLGSAETVTDAPAPAPPLHPWDAGADAGTAAVAPPLDGASASGADGGAAPGIVGNPLCFYSYSGAHNCAPDTSAQCSMPADAGAYDPWQDAAATDAGDAGDAGAPLPTACHVEPGATQSCKTAGAGKDGAQCTTGADCAASFECIGTPGRCRHYCCGGDTTCDEAAKAGTLASTSFCDLQPVADHDFTVPVCVPVLGCTLLGANVTGSCTDSTTCAVVKDDGTTGCVAIGPATAGQGCDTQHCAAGLNCLGAIGARTCVPLCELDSSSCPKGTTCIGSAQLFSNPNIGLCQ